MVNGTHIYQIKKYLSEEELECFIKGTIKNKQLTNKAYAGLWTILIGTFRFAKKKKYTNISITNFFGDIDIFQKAFRKRIVRDEGSVFTDVEVEKIVDFIAENQTLINFRILLAFQTGIRVGELAA